jgi:hypothetical protein
MHSEIICIHRVLQRSPQPLRCAFGAPTAKIVKSLKNQAKLVRCCSQSRTGKVSSNQRCPRKRACRTKLPLSHLFYLRMDVIISVFTSRLFAGISVLFLIIMAFFFGRRYGCGYVWIFTRITIGVWAYPRVLRGGWRCGIYTLRGWCHRISATNGGRMRGAWRYNDVFV